MQQQINPPSASGGAVALSAEVATAIGGVNQNRSSITITSNDSTQVLWVLSLDNPAGAVAPTAAYVKANGTALRSQDSSIPFPYGLSSNGAGGVTPVIWGVAGTSDQVIGTNDTRWTEGN